MRDILYIGQINKVSTITNLRKPLLPRCSDQARQKRLIARPKYWFASLGLYPFSVALAGIISSHFGPSIIFPISAAMMLGASAFGWFQREIREL